MTVFSYSRSLLYALSFWCSSLLLQLRLCSALSPDGLTLLAFKTAVSGDPSATLAAWDEGDGDPCRWPGVSCDNVSGSPYPRVVGLSVADKNLSGYIPSELGSLIFLRRLNLHGNLLSGPIPPQLSNASSLHSLFLYGNNLSGPLPPSLCDLPRLQNLDLSHNALSGPIPSDLRNCRQLQRLLLASNRFSGKVPAGIWPELGGNLVQLDLSSNNLTGPLPPDLSQLKSLSGTLNLSHNQFSGEIPSSLGDLPAAVSLDLRGNALSGQIPQAGILSSQGPTAFLDNPNLCGFPLLNPCEEISPVSAGGQISAHPIAGVGGGRKGLSVAVIVLIAAADAAGVAAIGLVLVYAYWKVKESSNQGCSCTGRTKLGGDGEGRWRFCCWKGGDCGGGISPPSSCSDESGGGGGGDAGDGGEGDLVAIDKGFSFELDELLRASAYVLGKGGMGIVYKVVLGNGVPVAVRRLGEGGAGRRREFAAEAQAVGRVRHPNVVRLRAYYWAPDEKLLISDFIPNGNLATALRGRSGQPSLSWSLRRRIAQGTARGLAHIHECSARKFVHGDLKPSNILLDPDFNPLVSDFGLLRLAHIASDATATAAAVAGGGGGGGFLGGGLPSMPASGSLNWPSNYRAPEARAAHGTRPAQKWDVYSFGVVLLELLTGRSPTAAAGDAAELVRWVRKGFEEERPLQEMVNPTLHWDLQARKEVVAAFHVALSCTETDPEVRPRMKAVAENLEKIGT